MQCRRRRPRPSYDQNQALRELQDSETWPLCEPKRCEQTNASKSGMAIVPHCRQWLSAQGQALHGQGGVGAIQSIRQPEKERKGSERGAHRSGRSQHPRLQLKILHTY